MRKAVKKQLIQLIDTILEAHIEVKKNLDVNKYGNARAILADCQDCAVMVGNTIEQFDEEQSEIITKLEKYCEQLFLIHGALETAEEPTGETIKKLLDAQIKEIRENVITHIHTELKVVFMPYKASMWTSLESIWKAAEADPDCEAKVVVIPYHTLNGKGQADAFVYEADQFPEEVPVTHYDDYDVAREQPDMIFIHNPYDGGNNLTRVPEKYYSYNLKPYTETLVYSPYGLMGYYNPDKGSFMCDTSAVFFADKILVQSEKVKEIYMNQGVGREKILAIGSPKVDAIVESRKKPVACPKEWESKLKGRTVFLMNTHLSYFINGYLYQQNHPGTRDFAKLYHERIINFILEREDCALIWRPHPLLKDMLKSRNYAESLAFVEQLEKKIEESPNGVMDRNGDYNISFGLSHALFTTYSSIIPEYMISGKPVYIYQNRYREDMSRKSPVCYINNYYKCRRGEAPTLPDFVDMVIKGEDVLFEKRMEDVKRAFDNLDGTVGLNVYQRLKNEWSND
ncbi:MAG: CDP-glycerol glycerophosphotransferase family protein [Lachnospiraceae bacterium]|nr:CDP-glycerol glycerophosphotransferase family protein [Lachnospiraceae bacterium]